MKDRAEHMGSPKIGTEWSQAPLSPDTELAGLVLLSRLAKWHHDQLWNNHFEISRTAQVALLQAGLSIANMRAYGIGVASRGYLLNRAIPTSNSEYPLLWGLGLLQGDAADKIERFADSIVFPLTDFKGRIRGFNGYSLNTSARHSTRTMAKSPWFRSGDTCFGLAEAKTLALETGCIRIVDSELLAIVLRNEGVAALSVPNGIISPSLREYLRTIAWRVSIDGEQREA